MTYLKLVLENLRSFAAGLPEDLRKIFTGAITSFMAFLASFPLELINKALQTVSLLIGIALAAVTLYRAFRHSDLTQMMQNLMMVMRQQEVISEEQETIMKRLGEIDEHGCTRHRRTVETLAKISTGKIDPSDIGVNI